MRKEQVIGAFWICGIVAAITAVMLLVPRCSRLNPKNAELWGMDQYVADSIEMAIAMRKDSAWAARQAVWDAEREARRAAREAEWEARKAAWQKDTVALRLQPFDPNTADSLVLLEVGLKQWQVRSLLRYRAAGGRYKKPEDMKKMYGMTDSLYAQLEPWISIAPQEADSVVPQLAFRTKKDTIVELNSADTTALLYIRGIGSVTAKRIVNYRDKLGGYVRVEQALEAGVNDSVLQHLTVVAKVTKPIRINSSSAAVMAKHPYMTYTQAVAIEDLRHKRTIKTLDQIEKLGCFTAEEWEKVKPYLSLE